MSDSGKILQIPENPSSSSSSSTTKPSFFNRSLTMSSSPSSSSTTVQQNNNKPNNNNSFNRTSSFKKLITSVVEPKVKKLKNIFLEAIKTTSSSYSNEEAEKSIGPRLAGTEDRIVVYLTSLRGVRRTYEDCYAVRMIFGGFRVWVDERDVSMDSAYRKELQTLLKRKPSLPQVFIRGNYVGGADVIKQLFETGQLAQTLKDFRVREAVGFVCESCADMRFVPCWNCSGSRKVFDEDQGSLSRCLECNENGLIRCPRCSSSSINV